MRATVLGALAAGRFGRAAVGLAVVVGGLGLASAPALAAPIVQQGVFPDAGYFQHPQAVAVDQSNGDVYVIDIGNFGFGATVDRFDAAGNPAPFSESQKQSYVRVNELIGTPSNSFNFSFNQPAAEIAVDNSGGPFDGDVYVTDGFNAVVDVFAPSGAYLGQLNGSGTPQGSFLPCGVAVDPSGRVYVGDLNGFVERYTATGSTLPVSDGDYAVSELSGVGGVCAVAADAAGNVFASTFEAGPLSEYGQAQFPANGSSVGVATEVDATSTAVAVDPSTGHVLVDEGSRISAFEFSAGTATLIEAFGTLSGSSHGVAVYDQRGVEGGIYASDEGASPEADVNVFVPAVPALPAVVDKAVTKVTATSGELHAQLDPNFADTTYHFEYGPTTAYGTQAPVPDADIGAEGGLAGQQDVSVPIAGLLPNTTYHYRAVATNAAGTTEGLDATFTTQAAGGPPSLPDGRAYEMVSPLDKSNSVLTGIDGFPTGTSGGVVQAAADGEAIVYASNGAFANPAAAPLSTSYLAARGANGWSTISLIPPTAPESTNPVGGGGPYKAFSSDLSSGLLLNSGPKPARTRPLTADAPAGYQNFYVQQLATGGFQAVLKSTPSETPEAFELNVQGATPDMSHMVFSTLAALTPEAVPGGGSGHNLYEWSENHFELLNILPKNESQGTPGAILGSYNTAIPGGLHAISDNGSTVFFTDRENLYVHRKGMPTVEVDESKEGLESGGGLFQTASADGSRVFFTDVSRLTSDSTGGSGSGKADLYELDLTTGQLSDLTITDPSGAGVQQVLGASEDGSYVYFVANGVLAPGAALGHCAGIGGGGPQTCNLYVRHRGTTSDTTRFIAKLSEDDNNEVPLANFRQRGSADDWGSTVVNRTARVTPDGFGLVFMSNGDLTGYDSTPVDAADCGHNLSGSEPPIFVSKHCEEVYVYDATGEGRLSCASCNPSGGRPRGEASIPGGTGFENQMAIYQSRVLSDENDAGGQEGARVFFDSSDALVPQDINGKPDVYEWEEVGRGSCLRTSASYSERDSGCVSLISSGTSDTESSFVDADLSGKNVFFLTNQQLAPGDTDHLFDLYDAREGGGFPAGPTPSACTGTGCQGVPPAAPIFATPSSATFAGVGNFPPGKPAATVKKKTIKCAKGKVKKKGKCAKRPSKKKRAKKSSRNRGARS
jgi:hypothetical protein